MDKLDKNKQFIIEAVVGLIVLITLIIFAVWLIVRNNNKGVNVDREVASYEQQEVTDQVNNNITEDAEALNTKPEEASVTGIDLTAKEREKKTKATGELPQVYTPGNPLNWTADNYQMAEIATCWDNYELEAVSDLIRLERVRKITDSLKGSNDYYYYGGRDADGNPEGKGLAIYADNTYYYGDFKHGLREGQGMWIRIFPDQPGVVNGISGVTWHQYSGVWSNDYPNGEGQENIQYEDNAENTEYESFVIQNAIGCFADGFYVGNMYIMTRDGDSTIDWYGSASKGVFEYISDKKGYNGKRAIWKAGEGYTTGEDDNCRWVYPKDNADYGIAGLKKA